MTSSYPPASSSPRLVGKTNTPGQLVLPSAGSPLSVTAGNAAYGSWVQVVASSAAEYYVVGALFSAVGGSSANVYRYLLDVGIGGAGSEVVEGTAAQVDYYPAGGTQYQGLEFTFPVPLRISAGTRIAVRSYGPSGTTSALDGWLLVVPYASVEGN